jgi:hypothetical protein
MSARSGGAAVLFNLLTILVFLLMLGVIAVAVVVFAAPDLLPGVSDILGMSPEPADVPPTPTLVALALVPTATDTPELEDISTSILAPTWTPMSPEEVPARNRH